jgi:hypothetical protein
MAKLPDAYKTVDSKPSLWLVLRGNVATIPCLVVEEAYQEDVQHVHGKAEPHGVAPVVKPSIHKVPNHGSKIGRCHPHGRPDANLSCFFVVEEHVLNKGKTRHESRRQKKGG